MTLNVGGSRQFYDNSYFLTAANAAFNLGTSDVFLSGWLYRDATGNQVIWAKYQDATNYWRFEITSGHKAHFIAVVAGVTQVEITGATSLSTTSTWYHVCVTIDRSGSAGCKIYVNGVNDTTGTPTTSVNSIDNTGGLYTGQGGASALYWQGRLQSLLLAKPTDVTSIASAAVASLYNTNSAKYYGDLTASEKTSWNVTLHYNCNEGSGTSNLLDQVSVTNDGVRTHDNLFSNPGFETRAGATWKSLIRTDKALWAATDIAPGVSDFSFAWLMKPSDVTTADHMFFFINGAGIDGQDGILIGMYQGNLYAYINDSVEAARTKIDCTTPLVAGTVYHVAINFDRSGSATWYLNGVASGSADISAHQDSLGTTWGALYICGSPQSQYYYSGQIAQLGYWTRLLDVAGGELTSLYNSGLGKYYGELTTAERTGCVAYWDCTDPTGTTLTDQCGTNDGTMVAAELVTNGDFETPGAGDPDFFGTWVEAGQCSSEGTLVHGGSAAAKLIKNGTLGTITQSSLTTVGRSYTLSAWARSAAGSQPFNAGEVANAGYVADVNTTYTQYSRTFTVASNTGIVVYPATSSGTLYVDDVSLKAASILTVSDADLFGSWVEAGSYRRCETTDPKTGAISIAFDSVPATDYAYQSVCTIGRSYVLTADVKGSDASTNCSYYLGGWKSFAVTTAWASKTSGTLVADHADVYIAGHGIAGKSAYWDSVVLTATTMPAAAGQSESASPVDGDPILSWTSDYTDASEFEQATAASRPTYNYQALHGHSTLTFDGTDDVIEFGASLNTATLGTLTIVFTTGATAFSADQALFASADEAAANVYFEVGIDSAGKCFVEVNDSGTVHRITGNTVLANSTSYMLEIRSDGSTWEMRLNGVVQTLTIVGSNSGKWLGDLSGRDNCTLGALVASSISDYLEGEIAEVMLYSTRLSDANLGDLEDYVIDRYDIAMA